MTTIKQSESVKIYDPHREVHDRAGQRSMVVLDNLQNSLDVFTGASEASERLTEAFTAEGKFDWVVLRSVYLEEAFSSGGMTRGTGVHPSLHRKMPFETEAVDLLGQKNLRFYDMVVDTIDCNGSLLYVENNKILPGNHFWSGDLYDLSAIPEVCLITPISNIINDLRDASKQCGIRINMGDAERTLRQMLRRSAQSMHIRCEIVNETTPRIRLALLADDITVEILGAVQQALSVRWSAKVVELCTDDGPKTTDIVWLTDDDAIKLARRQEGWLDMVRNRGYVVAD